MKNLREQAQNTQLSFLQVAEIEVSYRPHFKAIDRPKINGSKVCFEILLANWNINTIEYREEFNVLMLNRNNKVIGIFQASTGGQAGTVVDPKQIFGVALKANAAAIIVSHNHPSGNLTPSSEDIKVTNRLVECGKLLDLPVLDHIIITNDSYLSFADEGLL
uniref:JAB domain-containing protein n=1 Tax=Pedobacter sp. TaxID=1411316 RepID=UPI00159849B4|nr:JAB domain-containing protein [Pedobacter sp.]QJS06227.1 DNA repair protein RadC [Pedobacter sp.]